MDLTSAQPQKSFFKRFWWIGLIILIIIGFAFAWVTGHNQDQESDQDKSGFGSGKTEENRSLASDLPACPADTSTIFTKPFMDSDKPDFITPLGNSFESSHVVPVDHVYPIVNGYAENLVVYAPSDMTLIWVENKQMHNSDTDAMTSADYQLNFAPCRGLNFALIHLKKLSEKLDGAIEDENSNCDDGQKFDYGTQEGIPTYYVTCHPDFKKITISAGEVIGYFGGRREKPNQGFDIGLYDYNKPAVGFINPLRYYDDTNHTACFADYYIPELKTSYYAKFGSVDGKKDGSQTSFKAVSGEPKFGKVMHDVFGTAAGDWFKNKLERQNQTDDEALVLIHDNIETTQARLSMAGVISFIFAPQHAGTINREYSEVIADGKIYCYQKKDNLSGSSVDKDGKTVTRDSAKYVLQLIDDTHLKAEAQNGVCGTSEAFENPVIYER